MTHVTFIHGIGNKPSEASLLNIWKRNLAIDQDGIDLGSEGITSSMVYWADVLYAEPDPDTAAYESMKESTPKEVDADAQTRAPAVASIEEASFLAGLSMKIGGTLAAAETVDAIPPNRNLEGLPYERVPLPWPIKKAFLETFLRDVHHYLFNAESTPRPGVTYKVQDEIRKRFLAAIRKGNGKRGPHIVVSHSLGTVIAYDCLKRVPGAESIDGLVTIGSPLGLDEIQDKLRPEWTRADGFLAGKLSGYWYNVFDRLDPVAGFDPFLANDFQSHGNSVVHDVSVSNSGVWRHSAVKYLRASALRVAMRQLLRL